MAEPASKSSASQSSDASQTSEDGVRRTILFADVCKSTQIYEQHGDVEALRIVGGAVSVLSDVTTKHDGTVVKTIGDEVMSLFSDPTTAAQAAAAMHQAVRDEASLAAHSLHVKVGLHCGEVLLKGNDVYGDAVNVAARMVGIAEADQVITTSATLDHLPDQLRSSARSLGKINVRGKGQPIEICEYLWKNDVEARTTVGGPSYYDMLDQESSRLELDYIGEKVTIDAHNDSFTLGRSEDNDLVLLHSRVSRRHASIEFVSGYFVLTDRSSNGTYVRMGGDDILVHRDQMRLISEGGISLGRALDDNDSELIQFTCNYVR